jgi:hypothetical protein
VTRAQPSALERRCGARQADLAVIADAVARACHRCGAVYLDTQDGVDAHQVVFGHCPEGRG